MLGFAKDHSYARWFSHRVSVRLTTNQAARCCFPLFFDLGAIRSQRLGATLGAKASFGGNRLLLILIG